MFLHGGIMLPARKPVTGIRIRKIFRAPPDIRQGTVVITTTLRWWFIAMVTKSVILGLPRNTKRPVIMIPTDALSANRLLLLLRLPV